VVVDDKYPDRRDGRVQRGEMECVEGEESVLFEDAGVVMMRGTPANWTLPRRLSTDPHLTAWSFPSCTASERCVRCWGLCSEEFCVSGS